MMPFKIHQIVATIILTAVAPAIAQTPSDAPRTSPPVTETAIAPRDIAPLLQDLPQPPDAPSRELTFSPNSYGQQSINFRSNQPAPEILAFYRQALTAQGYQERPINTTSGAWGFSIVFIPPEQLALEPTRPDRTPALQIGESLTVHESQEPGVFLVIQAVALSPEEINVNLRFEEL
ncbi:MAG: hypothetical protein MH825_00085 [Cyanobacteria bacterium]|nr:hypothetical protein [Cyanobacteriota bacterium]